MTYEEAKHRYYRFKHIETAWHANGWTSIRSRDKDSLTALRFYMAEKGCLSNQGKYEQWYEVCSRTGSIKAAEINLSGFISERSIIRKPGYIYVPAWDEREALKLAKQQQDFS